MAAKVLEESGATYYYSTRSDTQDIQLVHGHHVIGAMEEPEMVTFCHEHSIRLIIDAAHPFAVNLHRNVIDLAKHISVPVIRFDRIYPPHDEDLVWCKDYDDAISQLNKYGITMNHSLEHKRPDFLPTTSFIMRKTTPRH